MLTTMHILVYAQDKDQPLANGYANESDGKARRRGKEGRYGIAPELLLANTGIDLQMHAVMHRERGRAEMNGEGRRLDVEVERAETDGGEEGECEEKTDFVHTLEKMEGKRISWKLK